MSDYFTDLGKAMAAELARHPAQRERLRSAADSALSQHLARPGMARDAMPGSLSSRLGRDQDPKNRDIEMAPRGAEYEDQYADQAPVDPDELLQFVRLILAKLAGTDREQFVLQLSDLLSTEDGNGDNGSDSAYLARTGVEARNQGALDRRRRLGARDSRRQAQDSAVAALNAKSFAQRWPQTVSLRFGGTGR